MIRRFFLLFLLTLCSSVGAQSLTSSQYLLLKGAIASNPVWSAYPRTSDGDSALAAELNKTAVPAYVIWRTTVAQDEIMANGFDWVQVDNLSVGKARIWEWMFNNTAKAINCAKANVRAGIAEAWKGTAAMLAVQAAILDHCKRGATFAEQIFAAGSGTAATPSTPGWTGSLSGQDIDTARNLP